jgi:integrase
MTTSQCDEWARRFARQYHSTFFNNTVGTLRQVLDIAVKAGARFGNPADEIRKQSVRPKRLALPSQEQFQRLVEYVETRGGRFSHQCADFIRFLAFGGFRRGEAKHITWADCDFKRGMITVRGDPDTGTKNHETRQVPMIANMRQLLERLHRERGNAAPFQPVMQINESPKAIDRASRKLGSTVHAP